MLEQRLIDILAARDCLRRDLELVQSLGLPHWCIAAGYVRNYVWDVLHYHERSTPLNDVDVLYYDPSDLSEETEKRYEAILKQKLPAYQWSVKNQARMHMRNNDAPYVSVEDAMKRWPETVTAVGVTLDARGELQIMAPHGLKDLFEMKVRQSPYYPDRSYFEGRVREKNWLTIWPKLELIEEDEAHN
ncbi:nucleotidyltransferase family protein [Cohnella lubricantis]|uniref:Nucleotidyltransferase family protein n=1 Tax=Cohnella lubricantis TaxID=2163172 RepID=A0A841TA29_9BACL|nr:nucleotidyltransferase family protein [Cohnella lubricantis]MBB6677822.1 nucleotidyltransferase family protein [Cohnella lubricantis]MBP2120503.1 hypothetical protein [Cohnella lubricantis]